MFDEPTSNQRQGENDDDARPRSAPAATIAELHRTYGRH
jgi:hypothetical protein